MSEHGKKAAAGCMLLLSLLLCTAPALFSEGRQEDRYRARETDAVPIQPIKPEQDGPVRINEADSEELTELPGVGETYASYILTERGKNGPFHYAEDLLAVRGIGPKTLEKMRNMIDLTVEEGGE